MFIFCSWDYLCRLCERTEKTELPKSPQNIFQLCPVSCSLQLTESCIWDLTFCSSFPSLGTFAIHLIILGLIGYSQFTEFCFSQLSPVSYPSFERELPRYSLPWGNLQASHFNFRKHDRIVTLNTKRHMIFLSCSFPTIFLLHDCILWDLIMTVQLFNYISADQWPST